MLKENLSLKSRGTVPVHDAAILINLSFSGCTNYRLEKSFFLNKFVKLPELKKALNKSHFI
jgi:hypothetical protein